MTPPIHLSESPELLYARSRAEGVAQVALYAASLESPENITPWMEAMKDVDGFDEDLFQKAQNWSERHNSAYHPSEVLSHYALMDTIANGGLQTIDLPALLRASAKPGVQLGSQRMEDYELHPIRAARAGEPRGFSKEWRHTVTFSTDTEEHFYSIYLDAPVGIVLCYKSKPNAVVAMTTNGREMMIHQLQGIKGYRADPRLPHNHHDARVNGRISSRGLMPLDWQKLMVQVATEMATKMGATSLGIQGSKNIRWTKPVRVDANPRMTVEAAIKAYDDSAQRLGFIQEDDGNWRKAL